jgi:transposase
MNKRARDERDALICAAATADPSITMRELCAKFNMRECRVYRILARAGVKRKPVHTLRPNPCAARDAEVVAFVRADPDATFVQIGEKFGLTYRCVFNILKRAGLKKPRSRKGNPAGRERNAVAAMMAADGMLQKEIAAELKVDHVSDILKRYDPEWQTRITAKETVRAKRDAEIIQIVRANPAIKTRELAEKFGMSTSGVYHVIEQAGLTKPRVSYEPVNPVHVRRNEMIIAFVRDNPSLTLDDIGEKWGMSGAGLWCMLKRAGISKPRGPYETNVKRERNEVIAEMMKDGMSQGQIAAEFGITRMGVSAVLRNYYPELMPMRTRRSLLAQSRCSRAKAEAERAEATAETTAERQS